MAAAFFEELKSISVSSLVLQHRKSRLILEMTKDKSIRTCIIYCTKDKSIKIRVDLINPKPTKWKVLIGYCIKKIGAYWILH
jgi:hypothetical protein